MLSFCFHLTTQQHAAPTHTGGGGRASRVPFDNVTESFRITANTTCSGPLVWRCAIGRDSFSNTTPLLFQATRRCPVLVQTRIVCNWFWHHPFSELSASAGELLHDSLADSNLHGHRPAISSRQHPLMGSNMSQHSDPISALSDHPASPVLLTSEWPTWSHIHRSNAVVTFFHHSVTRDVTRRHSCANTPAQEARRGFVQRPSQEEVFAPCVHRSAHSHTNTTVTPE